MSRSRPLSPDLDARIAADPELSRLVQQVINESIGESLREARVAADLSQAQVAEAMGVSRSRVSQIESAEGTALSLGVLSRYANAVGCRLDIDLVNPVTEATVASVFVVDDAASWKTSKALFAATCRSVPVDRDTWSSWLGVFHHPHSAWPSPLGQRTQSRSQLNFTPKQAKSKAEAWANGDDVRLAA